MATSEEEDGNHFWKDRDNLTELEYLDMVLGSKYLPLKIVIPLTMTYLIIFFTGICGNITTCIVIVKNTSMQTATNYYLFNLAISDLILLTLGLLNEVSAFWQQYPWGLGVGVCKIRAYASEVSSYVSVLTIMAFSMERYLAICHPLRVHIRIGLKRPIRVLIIIWILAVLSATPFAIYTEVNYIEYPPGSGNYSADSAICAMLLSDMPEFPLYEVSGIVFFLIPMLVILVVYIRMGLKIRRSTRITVGTMEPNSFHGESRKIQSRKAIVRMLSAVVVMFFICWAPFHAQRLFYIYANECEYFLDLNEWLYIISGFLYYFSTTVNPILYNLMSVKYREAFKRTICPCKYRRKTATRENDLRALDSTLEPSRHPSRFNFSLRRTIGQAKEMYRYTSNREYQENNRSKECALKKMDSNVRPLLNDRVHPMIQQQSSLIESRSSKSSVL